MKSKSTKPTILLVEDDALIRKIMSTELEHEGFTVQQSADGEAALEIVMNRPIDVVLLDIILPKMDGLTLLRKLKEKGKIPGLPVYILSSLSDMDKVAEGIALGASGYFVKQADGREDLIKTVKSLFANRS